MSRDDGVSSSLVISPNGADHIAHIEDPAGTILGFVKRLNESTSEDAA